ncbi:MAG TPA: phenylalanine--tRNA ligase subunit beta [Acidimicrobiales bacterium]|nr:phenylalanine--tRNA ligase subunit beta [Acidimicrobiales bacterium]
MRVPLSWLRDFAPVEGDVRAVAEALDELGLVVEEIVRVGEGLEDVVVARVEEISAIAGADKIRRVVVDAGAGPVEVVCGAWNFAVGDLVPLAPVGAVLPGGFEIGRRKMKGVVSNGMLCSPRELDLADDHQGILVIGSHPSDAAQADGAQADGKAPVEPGTPLMTALGIERDVVYDIAVTANRPDAWSVAGVARDLAAHLRVPYTMPEPAVTVRPGARPVAERATVEVVDLDLCPRFTARVLDGVVVGPSPELIARRLTLAGMRPINNVVDASNYVMLELGQPTHPYDLAALAGRGLRVRAARPGETVVTLDGVERRMGERSVGGGDDQRDCVICDAEDRPVGIGGVMGGADSEIGAATTTVLLEAAYFTPMAVARTSKRLNLRTEASARFERGCDPWGVDRAAERLVQLLGGSAPDLSPAEGSIDVRGKVPMPERITVRTSRVNAVLGTALSAPDIAGLLVPIGFACGPEVEGAMVVEVPTFRPDTEREIDVIEEVARHYGYSRIARRRPHSPQVGGLDPVQRGRRQVREVLAGAGAFEAWTPSLLAEADHERAGLGPGGVTVTNPLTPDEVVLRRSMLPGLLKALAYNAARRQGELRLFEIGHVFPPPDDARVERAIARRDVTVVDEQEMLAVAMSAPGDDARSASALWQMLADTLGIGDVELVAHDDASVSAASGAGLHPTRCARVLTAAGDDLGVVGEVDPAVLGAFGLDAQRQRVGWLEVDLARVLRHTGDGVVRARPLSRYPSSDIDLAFVVGDDVPAAAVGATLRRAGGELLEAVWLFDVYRGPGTPPDTRSLAYRLRFCALDHTLTDEEVGGLRARCIEAVVAEHHGVLRA